MKIAHIAPPWITIPPKNYGGTETVIFHLVEELVARGHDVTLVAPADAQTSAKLVSFFLALSGMKEFLGMPISKPILIFLKRLNMSRRITLISSTSISLPHQTCTFFLSWLPWQLPLSQPCIAPSLLIRYNRVKVAPGSVMRMSAI